MRRRTFPALVLAGLLALTGCVADGKDSAPAGTAGGAAGGEATAPTAEDTMQDAKRVYDEAASVHLVLESENVPDDVDSVRGADGVGTHAPAFKGDFKARGSGIDMTVPVVSVDGKSYVKFPLTPDFKEEDLSSMGAPDPASIFAKDQGIDQLIDDTEELAFDGDKKRDGGDVVVRMKGTVPGSTIKEVLKMGFEDATYQVRYTVTDPSHEIRVIELVGPFYKKDVENTYRLKLDRYGEPVDIQKP